MESDEVPREDRQHAARPTRGVREPLGDQGRPATGGDPRELQTRKRRGRGWIVYALILLLLVGGGMWLAYNKGVGEGIRRERARVAASASAEAAKNPPADLACPDRNSDEAKTKAITDKPIVVISQPPVGRVLVMRKAVVVIVRAVVTGDVVVCGNDAAVALEVPFANSARLLMQGGHDPAATGSTGPTLYLVDGTVAPDMTRVWFSNHHPKVVPCAEKKPVSAERPRPCGSYYSSAVPSLPPSPSPSKK